MKCDICQGEYEEKLVARVYKLHKKSVVVEDVPAYVCNICGDTLLRTDVVEAIQEALKNADETREFAPVVRLTTRVAQTIIPG